MILRPTAVVTLGNLRYESHAARLGICLGLLPRGGSVDVRLPAGVRFDASPGDDASVDVDGGEGSERVLTGTLRRGRSNAVRHDCAPARCGWRLAELRPSVTFEQRAARDIIRGLASEVGVRVGRIDIDLDLVAYVAHPRLTAAEHIAGLCRLGGSLARVTGEGELEVIPRPAGSPDKALKYGRELTDYRSFRSSTPNVSRFAMGFGPAGSSSSPDAMKHTREALPESASKGGPGVLREAAPMLRTAASASDASKALQEATAARTERLEARCFLLPGMRPGQVFEVQALPEGFAGGPWLVTRVTHQLEADSGGTTWLEAESAHAESLLGQLAGAALSALGGLL